MHNVVSKISEKLALKQFSVFLLNRTGRLSSHQSENKKSQFH
jgi:hypothetical protein